MTSMSEAASPQSEFRRRLSSFLKTMKPSKASHNSDSVVECKKDMHELEKKTTISSRIRATLGKFSMWRTVLDEQDRAPSASEINSPSSETRTDDYADSEESFTDEEIRRIQEEFWRLVKAENNRYVRIPDHTKPRRGVYAVAPSPFVPDISMAKELLDRQERGESY